MAAAGGAASPVPYVTVDDPPFLLVQGDRDELVPAEQASVPAQLVIVKNGWHSLTAPDGSAKPTVSEIHQTLLNFLTKYLKQ